jgi:hypothetical protein
MDEERVVPDLFKTQGQRLSNGGWNTPVVARIGQAIAAQRSGGERRGRGGERVVLKSFRYDTSSTVLTALPQVISFRIHELISSAKEIKLVQVI